MGWELRRCLSPLAEIVAVDYPELDLTRGESIRQWVREVRPQVIINAAAYTAVDRAEDEPELALAVNGTAPGVLAEEARRLDAWLVHYSSDYVYDGSKREPYVETDPAAPLGAYGRSKLAGDQAVQAAGVRHLIFRLCWVYGLRGNNFLLTMQRLAREREALRVVGDQWGCPTWSRLVAEATTVTLGRTLRTSDPEGVVGLYHLATSGQASWHSFAQGIIDRTPSLAGKGVRVEPITTAEYSAAARRPAWSVLSCEKLERTFGLRLPDWEATLDLALEP